MGREVLYRGLAAALAAHMKVHIVCPLYGQYTASCLGCGVLRFPDTRGVPEIHQRVNGDIKFRSSFLSDTSFTQE